MRKFSFVCYALFLFYINISNKCFSQSVGINNDGSAPHPSAMLDIKSTNKGLLIPRMNTASRSGIASPATGLFVFDTDVNEYYCFNGTAWIKLGTELNTWGLNGNAGTNATTHFIGTLDNQPLLFRIKNLPAGILDSTLNNTALGFRTVQANTTGVFNSSFGYKTLFSNTTGNYNTAIGGNALRLNTTGFDNTALGYSTLFNNTEGFFNTAIGAATLDRNTTGNRNNAIGGLALFYNTTGNWNVAVGNHSLYFNEIGSTNTAVGSNAIFNNTTGNKNTAVGDSALYSNASGNKNIAIGADADVMLPNLTNAIAIGSNSKVGASNSLVLGGTGANAVNVGIGVNSPIATLHVKGSAKIFAGANTHSGNFWNGSSNVDGFEITSSGNDAFVGIQRGAGGSPLHVAKSAGLTGTLIAFFSSGPFVGDISTNGSSISYNTTSDARLKVNRKPTQYNLKTLMQIEVEDYNYISDNQKVIQTGFVAQKLYKLFPQSVKPGGADPKTNPWMIDYSKLVPVLVKATQEQQQLIENQNKKIEIQQQQIDRLIKEIQIIKEKIK